MKSGSIFKFSEHVNDFWTVGCGCHFDFFVFIAINIPCKFGDISVNYQDIKVYV